MASGQLAAELGCLSSGSSRKAAGTDGHWKFIYVSAGRVSGKDTPATLYRLFSCRPSVSMCRMTGPNTGPAHEVSRVQSRQSQGHPYRLAGTEHAASASEGGFVSTYIQEDKGTKVCFLRPLFSVVESFLFVFLGDCIPRCSEVTSGRLRDHMGCVGSNLGRRVQSQRSPCYALAQTPHG